MKIIDLLNKIANDEGIPKKIKYDNQVFEYRKDMLDYYCYDYDLNLMGYQKTLNDEVEIIEEDKKIERIKVNPPLDTSMYKDYEIPNDYYDYMSIVDIQEKINEIIDYINKGD